MVARPDVMKYFDPRIKTELVIDASPVGLGAILTQVSVNQDRNVIAYASRLLTDCESGYGQTEKEQQCGVLNTSILTLMDRLFRSLKITNHSKRFLTSQPVMQLLD